MVCPYCGKKMLDGYMENIKSEVSWVPIETRKNWFTRVIPQLDRKSVRLGHFDFVNGGSALAYYCPDCQKVILDAADTRGVPCD